jgi:ribosomal 50S subunit-recycling heat shock protein
LDKTVATFVKTHVEAHKQLDAVVVELKTSTIANAREVNAIRDDFIEFSARTGAERYTVHSAFEDQKKQADELKAVWDSIHAIKLDIVKLQSVTKHE